MNGKNKYIVWSVFIIASLLLFLLSGNINKPFWNDVVKSIAGALLITGTFSVLHSVIEVKEEESFFAQLFAISSSIKESGLLDIKTDSKDYSFKSVLKESKEFTAVLNDGRSWVIQHYTDLKTRVSTDGTTTDFLLVDPDGLFIPALAQKTNYTNENLKAKINECVQTLKDLYTESDKKGSLRISFLKNYPTQSLYFTDDKVIVTPYQIACGRNTVPVYVYSCIVGNETIGEFLVKDLKNIIAESRMIWNNGKEIRIENNESKSTV